MTEINIALAGSLLDDLVAWADMTPQNIRDMYPDWNPDPATYQDDLERFIRRVAVSRAAEIHPDGLPLVKAAMRWVLRDAPGFASYWAGAMLFAFEQEPEPMALLWEWAWEAVFADEPWAIEGETFELYEDVGEHVSVRAWNPDRDPERRPFKWDPLP